MRISGYCVVAICLAFSLPALAEPSQQAARERQSNSNAARPKAKPQSNTNSSPSKAKQRTSSNAGAALFVVTQDRSGSYIEPLVGTIQGRYIEPPSGASENFAQFAERYYRAGQKYRLLFGGGSAGVATVKDWSGKASDCGRSQASVDLETTAKIGGLVMGIATNSDTLGGKTSSRRLPAANERSAVSEMAQKVFRQKGVSATSLQSMKTVNMTATDLDGDGKAEVIASFTARMKGKGDAVHRLFLIAQPDASGFDLGLMKYSRTAGRDLPEGTNLDDLDDSILTEVLVDQLDLDKDNFSEVITMTKSFEGTIYKIHKKQKNQWVTIYEFYSYRCAY